MSEIKLDPEIQEKLNKFFKGKVNVYEASLDIDNPERIQDRAFFDLFPEGATYLASNKEATKKGSYVASKEPTDDFALDTESKKFLEETEKRFNKVKDNAKIIIINPDVIQGRYASDDTRDRSLGKAIVEFLDEKLKENKVKEHKAEKGDGGHFEEPAFQGNSPFSLSLQRGATVDNLDGDSKISLVVASNPDKPMHWLYTSLLPGTKEQIEKIGFNKDHARKLVLYHEIGHALDPYPRPNPFTASLTEVTDRRHKTECLADAHAALQTAKEFGTTEPAKLMSHIRAYLSGDTIVKLSPQYREAMQKVGLIGKYKQEKEQSKEPKDNSEITKKRETLKENSKMYSLLNSASSSMAYNVNPVSDKAIEFADKALKDGSLQKMSDKEILKKSEELVEEHAIAPKTMDKLTYDIVSGDMTSPEVQTVLKRYGEALQAMPISNEKMQENLEQKEKQAIFSREISIMKSLGIPIDPKIEALLKKPEMKDTTAMKLDDWRISLFEKMGKRGADRKAILSVISEEKNNIRKADNPLSKEKTAILNTEFLSNSKEVETKVKSRVNNQQKIKEVKEEEPKGSSIELIRGFLKETANLENRGKKMLQTIDKRDRSSMTLEDLSGAIGEDAKRFNKVIEQEAKVQAYARAVSKNKGAMSILTKANTIRHAVKMGARGQHREWIDDLPVISARKQRFKIPEVMAVIKTQRQDLANEVNNLPGLEDVRGFRSYNKGTPLKRKKEILRKKIGGQMAYRKRVER